MRGQTRMGQTEGGAREWRRDGAFLAMFALLALGGGNSTGPAQQAVAEWLGLALFAAAMLRAPWTAVFAADRMIALLIAGFVALALVQLVPLAPTVWPVLGGRALYAQGDVLMLGHPGWRPLSLDPDQTVAALTFVVTPFGLWLRARSDRRFAPQWIAVWLVAMAVSLVLAIYQAQAGADAWHLYHNSHSDLPTGLFSNRNHQALAMACTIPLAAAWDRQRRDAAARHRRAATAPWVLPMAIAGAVLGSLLTGSRTGNALLVPALAAAAAIAWRGRAPRVTWRWLIFAGLALVAIGAIGIALVWLKPGGALGLLVSRSYLDEDDRYAFWPVVWKMIAIHAPWGAGFGSFRRLFEVYEPTDLLAPLYFNHAHSDWLELALEGGFGAMGLAALFVVWAIWRWVKAWQGRSADPIAQAAGTVVVLVLLHSVVDYPLRTIAIAACFAVCVAWLSPPIGEREVRPAGRLRRLAVAGLALAGAIQIGASELAAMAEIVEQPVLALRLPLAHARADAIEAWQQAVAQAPIRRVAHFAVLGDAGSPLAEPAFAASARAFAGTGAGDALLDHALALSRRDPWALQAGFARAHLRGDADGELAMLAAMVRLQTPLGSARTILLDDLARPQFSEAAVTALAARPRWRSVLIAELRPDPAAAAAVARLVTRLRETHAALDDDEIVTLLEPLAFGDAARRGAGVLIWQAWLGSTDAWSWPAPASAGSRVPFAWTANGTGRISVEAGAPRLVVAGHDNSRDPVASRVFALAPGTYRFVAKGAEGLSDSAIGARLTCDAQVVELGNPGVWRSGEGCRVATLEVLVNAHAGAVASARLVAEP